MSARNDIIDGQIKRIKDNLEYDELQLEFHQKRGNEKEAKRYEDVVKSKKKDIEIWESMKEKS